MSKYYNPTSINWPFKPLYTFNPMIGCKHNCSYCMDGETNILMSDGTYKFLKDIQIGDKIIGLTNNKSFNKLIISEVTYKSKTYETAYKILLSNNTKLIASKNHRFLSTRGYKYVIGKEQGKNRRPFLTNFNKLVCISDNQILYNETNDYKKGYIRGIFDGDGTMNIYKDKRTERKNSLIYSCRLCLKDIDALNRTYTYLLNFNIITSIFNFTKSMKGIRLSSLNEYKKMVNILNPLNTIEWYRGYVSGIFDAEGTSHCCRMFNSDKSIIKTICKGLNLYNFKYSISGKKGVNKYIYMITIKGGIKEHLRFFNIFNPSIKRKLNLIGNTLKNKNNPFVLSIKKLKKQTLYDITTTSENFIANGIVSHNCYAKRMNDRFKWIEKWTEPQYFIERIKSPVPKKPSFIFIGSMCDLFGDWVNKSFIDCIILHVKRNPQHQWIFLTKNPKRYNEFVFPDNVWLGVTVTDSNNKKDMQRLIDFHTPTNVKTFVSIEPLLGDWKDVSFPNMDLIIVGALTGSGADDPGIGIVKTINHFNIWYKDSIRKLYPTLKNSESIKNPYWISKEEWDFLKQH